MCAWCTLPNFMNELSQYAGDQIGARRGQAATRTQQRQYMEGLRLGSALAKTALMTAALMSVQPGRRIERRKVPKARRDGSIASAATAPRLTLKNTAEP